MLGVEAYRYFARLTPEVMRALQRPSLNSQGQHRPVTCRTARPFLEFTKHAPHPPRCFSTSCQMTYWTAPALGGKGKRGAPRRPTRHETHGVMFETLAHKSCSCRDRNMI